MGRGALWSTVYILSGVLQVCSAQFGWDSNGNCEIGGFYVHSKGAPTIERICASVTCANVCSLIVISA